MNHDQYIFAVSSLSCAPANILHPYEIILPPIATKITIKRLAAMRQALQSVIPQQAFSTSFHVGYMIHTNQAMDLLHAENIPVSSLDTPDIRTLFQCVQEMGHNIKETNFKNFKENIGWQLASVTNYQNYERKVHRGISALINDGTPHFVRTSGGAWYKSEVGNTLISILKEKRKQNPDLALAIEIDARHQTPHEYFRFVADLNKKHPDVPIYYDIDVGHLAESLNHHATFEHETLLEIIQEILYDEEKSKMIGILSLNQYDHETEDIHISLLRGSIDYTTVLKYLGEATRAGNLAIKPTILAEFSPLEYEEMISTQGVQYFNSLINAFSGPV